MRNGFTTARDCNAAPALRRVDEFSKPHASLLNAYSIHKTPFSYLVHLKRTITAMFLQPVVKASVRGSANKSGVGPNRIASGGVGAIKTRVATMETLTPPKQLADPCQAGLW